MIDLAKIQWNLKMMRTALELWDPILEICKTEAAGNLTQGSETTLGFNLRPFDSENRKTDEQKDDGEHYRETER